MPVIAGDIYFDKVRKEYGRVTALEQLDLRVAAGERLVLLGPSGCGKTTALRLVAGLERVTSGKLYLNGRLANNLEPGERDVAMVFQNYALYPHMTVWENIAFGLQVRRVAKEEIKARIKEALAILGLEGLEERRPRELSGGQRQRVALARAIVKQAPYFLLDEPLSNLDAQLRTQARTELVRLHRKLNSTMIYVTHDQVEAMTIGQRIAILAGGVLQQVDTPENIYNRPANTFVAKFIGNPPMNLLPGIVKGNQLFLGEGLKLIIPGNWSAWLLGKSQNRVIMGLRPEDVTLREEGVAEGEGLPVRITWRENCGKERLYYLAAGDKELTASFSEGRTEPRGGELWLTIDWDKVHFFAEGDGNSLGYPWNTRELSLKAYA
ncbi:sn-glycerol-3-phosphate import ATP-binding protein UgpC [Moorella thermoacetica]|uniref:sn-glycerol-3-phosphate import ATP-binding protein UgpC n=1 Tax=Neomoorella thermoacetica TaxID=1525 RepID=A0A1J5N969_NEOTH|nr:sn-glycerol-3-phosphate import ATP-binding protein UgpC [Moorella thermoacetica]